MKNKKIVQYIKDCGQSLIDNAETIADYDYIHNITITCNIYDNDERIPSIQIATDIFPEGMIERNK
jgi:hypothetical protein